MTVRYFSDSVIFMSKIQKSLLAAITAFTFWGLIPVYWKQLSAYDAFELNGLRVIFSFIALLIIVIFSGQLKELRLFIQTPKMKIVTFMCSVLLLTNWTVFLWAVSNNYIIEASIGYFINPLVSVLLGVFVLKEKLSFAKKLSVFCAAIGIVILFSQGIGKPWISLVLAFTFALYGLFHKIFQIPSAKGLVLETFFMSIPAIFFLYNFDMKYELSLFKVGLKDLVLGILSGPVTLIPLFLFGKAVVIIPLSTVGLIQYIAPTLQLLVGVLLYNEAFSTTHMWSFVFIWSGLIIYSVEGLFINTKYKQEA